MARSGWRSSAGSRKTLKKLWRMLTRPSTRLRVTTGRLGGLRHWLQEARACTVPAGSSQAGRPPWPRMREAR
eukprot:7303713-Lingulodinium_polyedra.AAC.1